MPIWGWIIIGIAIGLVIAAVIVIAFQARKSSNLKHRFGPEYERTVADAGHRQGEAILLDRKERHASLDIRPLDPADRERFLIRWRDIQEAFVDRPAHAVTDAASLLDTVMSRRGYPVENFDEQADLISVDHPDLVQGYRGAQAVVVRNSRNEATTEELRGALLRFRALFAELLETGETDAARPAGAALHSDGRSHG